RTAPRSALRAPSRGRKEAWAGKAVPPLPISSNPVRPALSAPARPRPTRPSARQPRRRPRPPVAWEAAIRGWVEGMTSAAAWAATTPAAAASERHPLRSRGFTLIELLVALFIAAVMFAMGYGAIHQALVGH